jgi:hypothetical protein
MNFWPELRPETAARIEAILRRGDKIAAIIIYREATGTGLKEAKDAIDRGNSLIPKELPKPAKPKYRPNWRMIFLVLLGSAIFIAIVLFRLR